MTALHGNSPEKRSAVILFIRIGPYHAARLREAAPALREAGYSPIVIEIYRKDATYEWDRVEADPTYSRHTLFDDQSESRSWRQIYRSVTQRLDQLTPSVVIIPGWANAPALSALHWCRKRNRPSVLLSESTAQDYRRQPWTEWIKSLLIKRFDAALVGGTAQRAYLENLGFPAAHIYDGYNVVDNQYFSLPQTALAQ